MIHPPFLTLAAGWFELVLFAVVGIVSLIQYIIKKAKEADQERQRRQEMASSAPSPTTPPMTDRPTLLRDPVDPLRRQRLAKKASQEPNNLTLQQMKARAQAKALYEKRAAELRRQQAPILAKPVKRSSAVESQVSGPANRPVKPAAKRTILPPSPARSAGPSSVTTTAPDHGQIDAGESVVHRHVADAVVPASSSSSSATVIPGTSGGVGGAAQVNRPAMRRVSRTTLRRAMMLKEILDPPMALRD